MDIGRIIQMLANRFLRKAVNTGVKKGITYAARKGKPAAPMTEDGRKQAAAARETAQRARQAAKLARRLGR